jgi:hypothetical protein
MLAGPHTGDEKAKVANGNACKSRARRLAGRVFAKEGMGGGKKRPKGGPRGAQPALSCRLKNASVRSQASLAAAAS